MSEHTPARAYQAGDLLGGEDADLIVNLYVALLGRWPDPAGFGRYLAMAAEQPESRLEILREIAASEEAQRHGRRVDFSPGAAVPVSGQRALATMVALRTEWLKDEVARLQAAIGLLGGAGLSGDLLAGRDAALMFEINALRREVTEGAAATGGDAAVAAVARLVAEHSADLVAAAEAGFEARLRRVEARLLALEARG